MDYNLRGSGSHSADRCHKGIRIRIRNEVPENDILRLLRERGATKRLNYTGAGYWRHVQDKSPVFGHTIIY